MSMRRFNAWLRVFVKSPEYDELLFIGWAAVVLTLLFFLPLRALEIVESLP